MGDVSYVRTGEVLYFVWVHVMGGGYIVCKCEKGGGYKCEWICIICKKEGEEICIVCTWHNWWMTGFRRE